jgi:hypothetical protein
MNAIIIALAITVIVSIGFLAMFVVLRVAIRAEGSHLSPSSAPHTRTENAARGLLGLYVRREIEKTPVPSDIRR